NVVALPGNRNRALPLLPLFIGPVGAVAGFPGAARLFDFVDFAVGTVVEFARRALSIDHFGHLTLFIGGQVRTVFFVNLYSLNFGLAFDPFLFARSGVTPVAGAFRLLARLLR